MEGAVDLVQLFYVVEDGADLFFTDDGLGARGEGKQRLAVELWGWGGMDGRERGMDGREEEEGEGAEGEG
jgi:hypothetical protein